MATSERLTDLRADEIVRRGITTLTVREATR